MKPVLVQLTMNLVGASGRAGELGYLPMPHEQRPRNCVGQPVLSRRPHEGAMEAPSVRRHKREGNNMVLKQR